MPVHARIQSLIRGFRSNGHLIARIDPLRGYQARALNPGEPVVWHSRENITDVKKVLESYLEGMLDLSPFGLEDVPKDTKFDMSPYFDHDAFQNKEANLEELVSFLVQQYCETLSLEYMHIDTKEQVEWLRERFESSTRLDVSTNQKRRALKELIHADTLENFLATTFPAAKKFGIEGGWSLIPGIMSLLHHASEMGVEYFEMGMTHRGRLNVLINVLKKPMRTVLREFQRHSQQKPETEFHRGDVQYHLGAYSELEMNDDDVATNISDVGEKEEGNRMESRTNSTPRKRRACISLCPNPSHLESINPVVMGKVRAKQTFLGDRERSRVLGILLHGDASFSGQGVVHETMELSNLDAYTVGGMVHIVINNQIGFTTDPRTGRSSVHPTNVAKAIGAPVFHVNGDCVQGVMKACMLAVEFRQKFKRDAVVNLVCYRKHGHNELDDPSITHPLTYRLIDEQASTLRLYLKGLMKDQIVDEEEVLSEISDYLSMCQHELEESVHYERDAVNLLMSTWQGDAVAEMASPRPFNQTGVKKSILKHVGQAASTLPDTINAHPKVQQVFRSRAKAIKTEKKIDFAFAEVLAFGSLMLPFKAGEEAEGKRGSHEQLVKRPLEKNAFLPMVDHPTVNVRLSGQDCERGTFNQRHAAIIDQETAARYVPLDNIAMEEGVQARFHVCNSSLSEEAALGYEYGYSLENDNTLVMWEAQFGDFANNAQSIIDNFIASGEDKWLCQSGLVLLLPHGYEGQGPEHSSARLERYLQLVNDDEDPDIDLKENKHHIQTMLNLFTDKLLGENIDKNSNGIITMSELIKHLGDQPNMENIVELQSLKAKYHHEDGKEIGFLVSDYVKIMSQWLARNEEAKYNMSVCNVTTPANYFHVLRRQIHRPFAKPLVLMSPKYLLHHAAAVSDLKDFEAGTSFDRVISDRSPVNNLRDSFFALNPVPPVKTRKVLICSGKIAYALHHTRKAKNIRDVVIVRLEQLAPFPVVEMTTVLALYPNSQVFWVQEEPKNMGGWAYVNPRLRNILRSLKDNGNRNANIDLEYIGRPPSASTACGSFQMHQEENKRLMQRVFR